MTVGTIGLEIREDADGKVDVLVADIGRGRNLSGMAEVIKEN